MDPPASQKSKTASRSSEIERNGQLNITSHVWDCDWEECVVKKNAFIWESLNSLRESSLIYTNHYSSIIMVMLDC